MTLNTDTVFVLLILSCFLLLGSSRLGACIRIGALQGILAGLLPWTVLRETHLSPSILVTGILVIVLKGVVFPRLLLRALREAETSREMQPFVGYGGSLIAGVVLFLASLWFGARLQPSVHATSNLAVPVAFMMMTTGLFLIVARRIAMTQVVGYLVIENGIYALGLAIVRDIPALVEIGVLMDVFVAVFVMGIAIFHINREFDHIDSDRLTTLKG